MKSRGVFVAGMTQGNNLFDEKRKSALLSLPEANKVVSDIPIGMKEFFLAAEKEWQKFLQELVNEAEDDLPAAGVLVTTPYAVALCAQSGGSVILLDSHAHGPQRGALLAVSKSTASLASIRLYLAR